MFFFWIKILLAPSRSIIIINIISLSCSCFYLMKLQCAFLLLFFSTFYTHSWMCYLFEFSGDFSHIIIIVTEKKSDNNDDDDTISYQNEIYFFLVHVETTQSYNMYTLNDEYGFFSLSIFRSPSVSLSLYNSFPR